MLITIMSSLAQEESRSISENITWGKRKQMADGKIYLPYKSFLGYEKGEDGLPKIVEEEAKIVRLIYSMFIEGKTFRTIANYLTEHNYPTPSKRGTKWQITTIASILRNEKYKGDALLQKSFTTNFLEKTHKKNEGELPQYYIQDSHPAIIDPEIFDFVQSELRRREAMKEQLGNSPFSAKIICGDCGGFYGQKVWHSNDRYRKIIYQCNSKFDKNHEKCQTPTLTEDRIKSLFIRAYNELLISKMHFIEDSYEILKLLTDTSELDATIEEQSTEMDVVGQLVDKLVKDNCNKAQNQEEYIRKYNELTKRFDSAKDKVENAKNEKAYRKGQALRINQFIERLKSTNELLIEWDDELWNFMIDQAIVNRDESITFKFKNGTEINEK